MKPHFSWLRGSAVLTAAGLLLASNGCSFLYNLNTNQCNSTKDCLALGKDFADTVCSVEQHVCIANPDGSGGASGTGTVGGNSSGGTSASGGSNHSGGSKPSGGGEADGGEAGSSNGACSSNADCIAAALDVPAICLQKDTGNECVTLTTEQCPVLLPTTVAGSSTLDLLKKNSPLILGGFATMNVVDPHETLAVINWDLAFEEFNEAAAKNSNAAAYRPVLGLICNGALPNEGDLAASMAHLTEKVGTPGILSTLSAPNLLAAFNYTRSDEYTGESVMFLSTSSATLQLANLDDSGFVWHLLGDPRLLAATVSSLVRQIEPYVRAQQADTTAPLKVALVSNDNQTLADMATVLTNAPPAGQAANDPHRFDYLTFNGDLAIHQNDNFYQEQIKSGNQESAQTAGEDILKNPPQIIIGLATSEFAALITEVESNWATNAPSAGLPRPYYVLSHYLATANDVLKTPLQIYALPPKYVPSLDKRIVGVNYALAQDSHSKDLYDSYLQRLKRFYGNGSLTLDGTENYYDGAYSMLYASSLTGRPSPIGADILNALQNRVLNPNARSVDIGPSPVETELPTLISMTKAQIALWGTDGPPNFDRVSGTRLSPTSAWCMKDAGNFVYNYAPDGLLYDATSGTFSAPTSGAPACLSKFQQ